MLAVLTSEQLSHAMFPLGDTPKVQVRAEAARRGLTVADKPDSHDVCFVADGDTRGFLAKHLGGAPGPIVDDSGTVIGDHDGTFGLRSASVRACGSAGRLMTASHATCSTSSRYQDGYGGAGQTGDHRDYRYPSGLDRLRPADRPRDCLVQLRAHGDVHSCTAWLDGRIATYPAAPPGARRGQGPGRGPVRRRHRSRQRDHQRHVGRGSTGPRPGRVGVAAGS